VRDRRNLRRFDLAASAPEHVGVENGHAHLSDMPVYRFLVLQHELFVGAMRDTHDVHVRELGAAFAPIGVGKNVMPSDFPAGFYLSAGGNAPMEERVVTRDALARSG